MALRVVARITECRLGEVVRAKGEKLGLARDLTGGKRGARELDHCAEPVGHGHALLLLDGLDDRPELLVDLSQLRKRADERGHDLWARADAALAQVSRG